MTAHEHMIRVQVKAGSRKERMMQVEEHSYNIEVREKAERGAANKRVRQLLAEALGCSPKELRMVKGATSPRKHYLLGNPHTP